MVDILFEMIYLSEEIEKKYFFNRLWWEKYQTTSAWKSPWPNWRMGNTWCAVGVQRDKQRMLWVQISFKPDCEYEIWLVNKLPLMEVDVRSGSKVWKRVNEWNKMNLTIMVLKTKVVDIDVSVRITGWWILSASTLYAKYNSRFKYLLNGERTWNAFRLKQEFFIGVH